MKKLLIASFALALTAGIAPVAAAAAPVASENARQGAYTKGTHVELRNKTTNSVWYTVYLIDDGWSGPVELKPGQMFSARGDRKGFDDVEIRLHKSLADANDRKNYVDLEAENPAFGSPWLDVDDKNDDGFDVDQERKYVTTKSGYTCKVWAKREGDSKNFKEFDADINSFG